MPSILVSLLESVHCANAPRWTRFAFSPLSARGENYCSDQCLHWSQQVFTEHLHVNGFESNGSINKKDRVADATLSFLAPPVGLEPTTCGLTVRRSTD